jgi:hypothetical protein
MKKDRTCKTECPSFKLGVVFKDRPDLLCLFYHNLYSIIPVPAQSSEIDILLYSKWTGYRCNLSFGHDICLR